MLALHEIRTVKDLQHLDPRTGVAEFAGMNWPVTEERFSSISDAVLGRYFARALEVSREGAIVCSLSRFYFSLIDYLHHYQASRMDREKIFAHCFPPFGLNCPSSRKKRFKSVLKSISRNGFFVRGWGKEKVHCMEFPFTFIRKHAEFTERRIHYLERELLIGSGEIPCPSLDHEFDAILGEVGKLGISLPAGEVDRLKSCWDSWVGQVNGKLQRSLEAVRVEGIKCFAAQSIGNLDVRIMAQAVKLEGGRIFGFGHAHDLGMLVTKADNIAAQILAPVTDFVVQTPLVGQLVEAFEKKFFSRIFLDIHVMTGATPAMIQGNTVPSSIKKVFVLEPGLLERRFKGDLLYWPYQVPLMMKLPQVLRAIGVEVFLKARPEHTDLSRKLYGEAYTGIIAEPFEKVLDEADAFIFPHFISTSTLVPALSSDRPVIIFRSVLAHVWNPLLPLLESRCMILDSEQLPDGQVSFNADDLTEMLNNPKQFSHFFL